MTDTTNSLLIAMKERRFTSTARVLGEEKAIGARVKIINGGQHAAWWDASARVITLNDAMPKATDAKQTLIWERAKLFHELFHVMFTTNESLRKKLMYASKDGNRYLWVSNVLEDGRIEYHGGKMYQGTTWYIRTLLAELVKSDSPDSALLIYVRTKVWRNKAEAKYWRKFVALIDEAITAPTSDTAWENAAKIVDAMFKPKPKQCKCPDCGAPMPAGMAKVNAAPVVDDECPFLISMAMSVCPTCGQTSTDDGGGDGGAPSPDDDGDDDGGDDGDTGGSESSDDGGEDADGDGGGQGGGDEDEDDSDDPQTLPDPTAPMDDDAQKELDDMIEDAKDQIDDEVEEELIELDSEVAGYEQEQEYVGDEEQIATELTEVFASLLVESERQKYNPCKVGGRLNTRRLIETQTGGDFMQESEDKLHQPHIVLLIDESCSMRHRAASVSTAARILNGAIQASGAESVAMSFGAHNSFVPMKVVPKRGFDCNGGSTPTGQALKAAGEWLDSENAMRGMVVVITDGQPSWRASAVAEFQTLAAKGYFVLNVLVGGYTGDNTMLEMCHQFVEVADINTLVRVLEEPLGNFLSGTF